jgi:rhamnosyltransferase
MISIACIIPTYNDHSSLSKLLDSIDIQVLDFDLFIIDSGSTDGSEILAKNRAKEITSISPLDFNHGRSRQLMVDKYSGYDVFIFLTQDVILFDRDSLKRLIEPFTDRNVGAVYGRQLPHLNASPSAQHVRFFNYPPKTIKKSISDIDNLGIKTAFLSNSFAAYRGTALNSVGGFPSHVIFAEDMYVAAKMLMAEWKIVYCSEALCLHSHNYSISEEFSRYFDMGVFHAREKWLRTTFGSAGGEGFKFVKSELSFLGFKRFYLAPCSILRNIVKFIGYKVGVNETLIPLFLKKKIGMHKKFWESSFAFDKLN